MSISPNWKDHDWPRSINRSLHPLLLSSLAGKIYGRVAENGRAFPGANISINCGVFTDSKTTDRNGVYRSSGLRGEEKCSISVNGSNPVAFFTSTRRTRVNLEIINNRLYQM